MLKTSLMLAAFLVSMAVSAARGQEYSVEVIDASPDAGGVSAELVKQFQDKGVRIKRGSNRTICEVWFCRQWKTDAEFKATQERLYPFVPGQLIGLLHLSRKGSDFRNQTVGSGWYTLRFGLQPVDGNHVGTSVTRDFLLMIDAKLDDPDKEWSVKDLLKTSAKAAGSSHPAMLCLQKSTEGPELSIRHEEQNDWWILHVPGTGIASEKAGDVPVDLIVVGHAAE